MDQRKIDSGEASKTLIDAQNCALESDNCTKRRKRYIANSEIGIDFIYSQR